MISPEILMRVKQPCQSSSQRIQAGEVWPLVKIAATACDLGVLRGVFAAVRQSNDVLDVKGLLRNPAVFAAILGSIADKLPDSLVHQETG